MRPILVMPHHDPEGMMAAHLQAAFPQLKQLFQRALIAVTPVTCLAQPETLRQFEAESFFDILYHEPDLDVGEQFHALYTQAATAYEPQQILHLCFSDRLTFALQSEHRPAFVADVEAITAEEMPLLFVRSEAAWETHPRNYRDIEAMATCAGEWLFGKTLDFAWCHLVLRAGTLAEILPKVKNKNISMLGEMMVLLREGVVTRPADWLAWEDPFLAGCDPAHLKAQREDSRFETQKRLAYILPTLHLLVQAAG